MSDHTSSPAPSTPASAGLANPASNPAGNPAARDAECYGHQKHHHHHRRGGFIRGLFAGVLLFGVVAGASYIGSSHAQGGMHPGMRGGHSMMFGNADPESAAKRIDAMVSFALANVDANAEQKAKISEIAKTALTDLMPLRDEHKAARAKAVELLSAATIDRAAIEQVRASELKLAETASKRITQAIADAADTLQPAQRAKLAEKMKQRLERRG